MDLSFHTYQTIATAGELLSGELTITATKIIRTERLELLFLGTEYTTVKGVRGKKRRNITNKSVFVKHKIRLANNDFNHQIIRRDTRGGYVEPGRYSLPFSFCLPSGIPASLLLIQPGQQEKAKIVYRLKASFIASGIFHDYQTSTEVQVRTAPVPIRTVPYFLKPSSKAVTKSGFAYRGDMTFGAKVEDSHLVAGQNPVVRLAVINDSAAALHRVQLKLVQITTWEASGRKYSGSEDLTQAFFQNPSGYAPKLDESTRQERQCDKNRKQTNEQEILLALHNEKNPTGLTVRLPPVPLRAFESKPSSNTDSTIKSQIRVTHELVVTLYTEPNKSNPEFHIPVQVVARGTLSNAISSGSPRRRLPTATATPVEQQRGITRTAQTPPAIPAGRNYNPPLAVAEPLQEYETWLQGASGDFSLPRAVVVDLNF